MSLSERFAKLASAKKTISSVVENRSVKRTTVITGQKVGRASAIQNKRGIEGSVKLTKPGAKSGKPLTKGKVVKIPGNGRKQGGKGKNMRGKVGKGRGRTGRGKNEAVKAEDLDRDLGLYMHKGGKGPNPIEEELDSQLDSYRAAKAT